MIMINTQPRREEGSTNELEGLNTNSMKSVENAELAGDGLPGQLIIECTNPYCQICHGIGGEE